MISMIRKHLSSLNSKNIEKTIMIKFRYLLKRFRILNKQEKSTLEYKLDFLIFPGLELLTLI